MTATTTAPTFTEGDRVLVSCAPLAGRYAYVHEVDDNPDAPISVEHDGRVYEVPVGALKHAPKQVATW